MTKGREFLNRQTRRGHTAVEEAFEVFDMESGDGMYAVLSAHIAAIGRLLPGLSSRPVYRTEIERLRTLALASRQALEQI